MEEKIVVAPGRFPSPQNLESILKAIDATPPSLTCLHATPLILYIISSRLLFFLETVVLLMRGGYNLIIAGRILFKPPWTLQKLS